MAHKQRHTLDIPTITAGSEFKDLLVPGQTDCVFVLPNFLCACPACGLIYETASSREAHIKGERINLACAEYSWKFGPCVRLELGQKQPSENNESPTKYPNIKWNNDNLGANVTNKALDEANKANKTWLEDHGFATTTSKRNDVELVAAATVTMISTANLEKFLHIKERDPDNFELVSAFWCAEHRKQMDDYVLSKKDIYLHDHDHQYYYWR